MRVEAIGSRAGSTSPSSATTAEPSAGHWPRCPGAELGNDVEVRIRGRVTVYPPTGRYQLVMTGIDPVFTVGGIAANRERVLRRSRPTACSTPTAGSSSRRSRCGSG